jgi:hypothetical protein
VLPNQVVDFKALVGDKSDNIPGCRVGKTAHPAAILYPGWRLRPSERSQVFAHQARDGRQQAYLSQT